MTSAPWSAAQTTPSMMSLSLAGAVGAEDRDGHDLDAGVADARDARAVVGLGRDDAGHGRAVAVRVGRPGRAGDERGAGDDVAVEVGVRGVDAGVEDGDDGGARPASTTPKAWSQPIFGSAHWSP